MTLLATKPLCGYASKSCINTWEIQPHRGRYKLVSDMTYEASPSRQSQGLFKTQRDHCKINRIQADHQTSNPNLISCVCRKEILRLLEFPLINSRNFLVMQSGVGDTGDTNIYHPNQQSLDPAVSIRQHITKKSSEIVYLNLRKASVIQVMAILPNSRPSTGWRRGYLTNEQHKGDFRCRAQISSIPELQR